MEGRLNKAVTYLSGPMEYAHDNGVGWRQEIINKFNSNNLNIICIDPTNKPVNICIPSYKEDMDKIKSLKEKQNWDELAKYVKAFRRADLRYVDLCDFLVAYINPKVHMCGTYNEIFEAERQKKPRIAIVNGGKEAMPSWLFAVFHHSTIFSTVDECVEYVKKLNSGEIEMNDKWVLIRKYLNGL